MRSALDYTGRGARLGLVALLVALGTGACRNGGGAETRPNVVVLLVDTLRADHLGAYGYPRPTSPHLDALAETSFLFEDARAQAPCTYPSANSILTGRFPTHFRGQPQGRIGIPADIPALAEMLQGAGYATAAVSASPVVRATPGGANPHGGFGRGFGRFDETCLWRDAGCVESQALEMLDQVPEPFFLYLHFMDPHGPYRPPPDWPREFPSDDVPVPEWARTGDPNPLAKALYQKGDRSGATPEAVARLRDLYDEEIRYFDHRLNELLSELRSRGVLERSIVVLLADHGEEFYEHGDLKHCHTLYDTEIRTPLLMAIPRSVERRPARRIGAPVANLDVVPTLLDYLGIPLDPALEGRSLRPLIDGEVSEEPERRVFAAWAGLRAMTEGRLKLIYHLGKGRFELYDLALDPGERVDLATSRPREVRRLGRSLARWMVSTDTEEDELTRDQDAVERLRALGYLN